MKNVLKIGALQIDLDAVNEDALEAHAQRLGVPPDASLNDAAGAVAKHTMTTTPAPVQGECEKCGGPLDERQERCALCGDLVPAPECTDLGNADRFVRRNLGRARYCAALGGWMIYCGPRWAADEPAAVRLAKDTARSIYGELERGAGDDPEALGKHAIKSQSAHALMAMLQLAQSEEGIAARASDFDRDAFLLNTPSGTLDLRTGELRAHDPGDLITKVTAAPYQPGARSELLDRVVRDAMGGDAEHVAFLARVLGYCLTGDTGEEKLFVILGPGATGKSTLIEAFKRALGDYALTADFETFISAKGGIRNDVARLAGARFVSSIEVEKGRRLAEGLVKSITGGDDVTARFLYREAFTFRPAFKLALVANDAPRADDNDTGLWRRIVKVPFEHVVPKEKRDPRVKADLCDAAISGPAILAWALAGCIEWQKTGLAIPASIERATEDYRASQDPLRDFFDEALVFDVGAKAARAALSRRYESWCKANAVRHPVAPKAFAERLRARGAIDGKSNGSRVWNGVGLVEDATEWPSAQGHEGTPGTPRDPRGVPASRPRNETRNDAQGHEGHQIQTTLPCTSTRGDFSKDVTLRDPGDPAGGFQAPARFRRRSAS